MFRTLFLISTLIIGNIVFGQKTKIPNLKCGDWTGKLQLNKTTILPFKMGVSKDPNSKGKYLFSVYNSEERIDLKDIQVVNDSMHLTFPAFNSKLVLKVDGKKEMNGYWLNLSKGPNYKIPCRLTAGYFKRFDSPALYISHFAPADINGRWEATFEPGTPDAYKAVGMFNQDFNALSGTFLTETGDYRFLEGNVVRDSIYLSCFDGSHAFLFTGLLNENGIIAGKFYSGKHWECDWTAVKNEDFELAHPDSLTYVVNDQPVQFTLNDLKGLPYSFPNDQTKNKVVIIQIMGTWCPNCMDETRYFKELYSKYNQQGLEIISIGYETGNDPVQHAQRIKTLQERFGLDFTFLVGGTANKGLASQHFSMLNQIISFPTAIFIGRDGKVKKVHTGFNGPGTGEYYRKYSEETELFIQELLK